jgi:chromosome partitioning protein
MPAYQPFLRFLETQQIKLLTRLLDSDMYLKAAESGIGIFEMDAGQTAVERRQFTPIVDWVRGDGALQRARIDGAGSEVQLVRRVAF